jgi:hypothetical protein
MLIVAISMVSFALINTPVEAGGLFTSPSNLLKVDTDPYSLINEVNTLRAEYGLPAYSINPILMAVAQQHAVYMSVAGVTHFGPGGSSPWQRGLSAGYPLAGDLTLGGFYSENITAGNNKSVQDAVREWQGDAPHLNTILSPNLSEIGAGVAVVGDYVYYVIDCAQPTMSRQPQDFTPAPGVSTPIGKTAISPIIINTLIPATPLVDGKLYHVVKPGETLWLIAISYGVKIVELRRWNNLTDTQAIFPGNKLFIQLNITVTPDFPKSIATIPPTSLPTSTNSPQPSSTESRTPRLAVAPGSSNSSAFAFVIIVAAALILAAVFVRAGRK